ncbi:hypothetical protein ACFY6U_37180 [Streptomyces sp. NPDC013157]|uniref:hypothetical protein n=1 Tax=Streptomyces sp. NPDC013157 TaxID=3364861 RepID=UPI003696E4E9
MTHVSIAACLSGEAFLAQAPHHEHRHVPGALGVAGLMTWDDRSQILAAHRLEPPRVRLSRDGETLLVGGYTAPVATRRHTVWHRLHPAELHSLLKEGASLALDSVDEIHPPLGDRHRDAASAVREAGCFPVEHEVGVGLPDHMRVGLDGVTGVGGVDGERGGAVTGRAVPGRDEVGHRVGQAVCLGP